MNTGDRRARRSRRLLQEAFQQLLTEKGFDAISVQDIAERADVNRGTFYAHFTDKYALLEDVVGEAFREALLRRVSIDAPFTTANLEQVAIGVLDYLGEVVGHCRISDRAIAPLVETSMRQELHKRLHAWIETTPGCAETHVPSEVAAAVMSWAVFGAGLEWAQGPRADSAESRARHILMVLSAGLEQLGRLPTKEREYETAAPV
jgi:AcrR family transcriptional regulator